MTERKRLSRIELYDLVWSQPMRNLPEVVGVSSTSIKNACSKFDIPVPDRGHWNKLKVGKATRRIVLPPRSPAWHARRT